MIQSRQHSSFFAALKGIALATILTTTLAAQAQNAPVEQTTAQLIRQASSQNSGTVTLSKNLFRTETVQVPYIERVPYQETETYVEQVPYTVRVPYTDYETDYRDEYRCETVTKYRDEYRCENVTRYRDETRCENVTRYRQECRQQQECHLVPGNPGQCRQVQECGTNAQGQPVCKTRTVCDGGSGPQQRCETKNVCQNVPYTDRECRTERVPYYDQECRTIRTPYTDQECRNIRVPYQREVTKYRDETRYRSETRTRTVTKYRDEQRCCRPEQRQVFDRQLQFQVRVNFPVEAVLNAGESERLIVRLESAQPAIVSVQATSGKYAYAIANQSASGEQVNVDLALVPGKYVRESDLSLLGDSKAVRLAAANTNGMNATLSLIDSTEEFLDVRTEYSITIYELMGSDRTTLKKVDLTREQLRASQDTLVLSQLLGSQSSSALRPGKQLRLHVIATRTGAPGSVLVNPVRITVKANISIQ
jgi:hypothetical protein